MGRATARESPRAAPLTTKVAGYGRPPKHTPRRGPPAASRPRPEESRAWRAARQRFERWRLTVAAVGGFRSTIAGRAIPARGKRARDGCRGRAPERSGRVLAPRRSDRRL